VFYGDFIGSNPINFHESQHRNVVRQSHRSCHSQGHPVSPSNVASVLHWLQSPPSGMAEFCDLNGIYQWMVIYHHLHGIWKWDLNCDLWWSPFDL
jgi:hypothetical protein